MVSADSRQVVSLIPTWTTTLETVLGSDERSDNSLSSMSGTVAPGRQFVMALAKRIFLVMESVMMSVLGGKEDVEM